VTLAPGRPHPAPVGGRAVDLSRPRRLVAGLLAVGDLAVGDKGDVPLLRADVGRPAGGAERLLALGEEGGAGGGELLPLGRDRPGPTLGIPALPAPSLSGCCALPSLVDLGRPGDAWPTRDRADLTIFARLACVLAHPCRSLAGIAAA